MMKLNDFGERATKSQQKPKVGSLLRSGKQETLNPDPFQKEFSIHPKEFQVSIDINGGARAETA